VQLARDELERYAGAFHRMLRDQIALALAEHCIIPVNGALHVLQQFFVNENYEIRDGDTLAAAEADERLNDEMLSILNQSQFLQQFKVKCDSAVLTMTAEHFTKCTVDIILAVLWSSSSDMGNGLPGKRFTDWGSLLLSKQVRVLQTYVSETLFRTAVEDGSGDVYSSSGGTWRMLLPIWERLSIAVTILQLERPSDWLAYRSTILSTDEVSRTMNLRVDFSKDAIDSVGSMLRAS
jgi:hypothetical protein